MKTFWDRESENWKIEKIPVFIGEWMLKNPKENYYGMMSKNPYLYLWMSFIPGFRTDENFIKYSIGRIIKK